MSNTTTQTGAETYAAAHNHRIEVYMDALVPGARLFQVGPYMLDLVRRLSTFSGSFRDEADQQRLLDMWQEGRDMITFVTGEKFQ
jgi:hypothetical protein